MKKLMIVFLLSVVVFLSACAVARKQPDDSLIDCRKSFAANDRYVVDMIDRNGILSPQYGTAIEGNVTTFFVPVGHYVGVTTGLNVSYEFNSGEPVLPTPCSDTIWYKSDGVGTTLFLRLASP